MALSNILVPNLYNIRSNSLTMNQLDTQPVPGNNTLWINNSDNNKLYLGPNAVGGLQNITLNWTPRDFGSNNTYTAVTLATNVIVDAYGASTTGTGTINFSQLGLPVGYIIDSLTFYYVVITNNLTGLTPTINLLTFANSAEPIITPITFTGTFQLAVSATGTTTYAVTIQFTNPITIVQNQYLGINVTFTAAASSTLRFFEITTTLTPA